MESRPAVISRIGSSLATPCRRRDFGEVAVAYGLIVAVIWTPAPWQMLLGFVAIAFIAAVSCLTFDGLEAMGLRAADAGRSLWVVGVASALAAIAVTWASWQHTLHLPNGAVSFFESYWPYVIWAAVQQFLLQCFLMSRLMRLLRHPTLAMLAAAMLFAAAHLPSPILTTITLVCGVASCLFFLRYRNLYALAIAHAILGIAISITIPGPVDHNMRVGLSYLTYAPDPAPSSRP